MASGVIWDEAGQRWVSEESLEETSQQTAVDEATQHDKEKSKDDSPIWIEWDSPTDPGNPFNVSFALRLLPLLAGPSSSTWLIS
jgi:hypothetical protein